MPQKVQAQAQPAAAHEDTPQVIFVRRAAVSAVTSDRREKIIIVQGVSEICGLVTALLGSVFMWEGSYGVPPHSGAIQLHIKWRDRYPPPSPSKIMFTPLVLLSSIHPVYNDNYLYELSS